MKKRCFALLLALSLLLTGCSPLFDLYSAFRGEYTRPDYSDGAISYRDFQRPYQPRVKYTAEPDIEYVRPDVDSLCSTLKSIGASATGGKAAAADIINQFDAAYDDYVLFNTMGELAYLRYTRDLSDSYYEAEYTWCTDQTTRVEKAMEDCYTTMAKSSLRSALEEQYFGEDFFASYDSDGVYSDARTVALLQQESELQAQYVALQNDPSIEWNGAVRSVSELLENAVTADLYYEVLGAYYDAYGAQAGEIYIKLIQTRRELAGRLGYGSYADYAYDALYYRDYTPAQAERYVERVRTELAPVYTEAAEPMQLSALSADETMQHLHEAADTLGGEVQTAMGFLDAYELYDITSSANKMPGSYTTYLESYEMPYIYISPEGTLADLLTAAHEYGHFVDGYVNCNQTFSIDCSEVFSQALEYLTLGSTSLGFARAAELRQYKLYDSLETFLTQACYYAFECKAYALPDSELTVEKLNELFAECCVDFGLFDEASAEQAARSWIDVQHFFSAAQRDMQDAAELMAGQADTELKALCQEELTGAKKRAAALEQELRVLLLPHDPNDGKNVILEIRPGVGGEESALFAHSLFRMYSLYAAARGWTVELLNYSETELGGIKEADFMICGAGAYSRLKFESGVHRVQRVPETESGGRVHTSTATVAVLPEMEQADVDLRPEDIEMQVYRSSGAGGQHINKTSSAVRLIHRPTGIVVACQEERSQFQNRERCMMMLSSKLYQLEQERIESAVSSERRSQVGSGMRNEKIRTYNFPQSRVTDHRIGLTLYQLDSILNGGLDPILDALIAADQAEKLRRSESSDKS